MDLCGTREYDGTSTNVPRSDHASDSRVLYGAAATAVHTPHGVQEKDEKSPERDEFKAPLVELVVSKARRLKAAGTDGSRAFAGAAHLRFAPDGRRGFS